MTVAERSAISQEFAARPVGDDELGPDYNIAPSKKVYAVVDRHDERQLRTLTWGLIPSWAKDPKIGNRMANARLETAAEKPSFRRAWASRRALLPANGYYEWYESDANPDLPKSKRPPKQPYYIHPKDGSLLAMAGLYEIWRDKTIEDENDPSAFRWTCTILTTNTTDKLGHIHDRMPLLVAKQDFSTWLDPELPNPSSDLLIPASPDLLDAYPVSTLVNRVANNTPDLLVPLPAEPAS